jgi:hypothetical protein
VVLAVLLVPEQVQEASKRPVVNGREKGMGRTNDNKGAAEESAKRGPAKKAVDAGKEENAREKGAALPLRLLKPLEPRNKRYTCVET